MVKKKSSESRTVAKNPKAFHDYQINETLEVGLVLLGSEVKSLRKGRASIKEAYAAEENGILYLVNANISEYSGANQFNHDPKRKRKLLLHSRELNRLIGAVQRKGVALIPLSIYFNKRGIAKLSLGLATGKSKHEKRASEKEREWKREKSRIMKEENQ